MMFWRRLPYLLPWRRRAAERDMQDELRSLAEMAAPGELGNLTLAAEDARAQWGWTRLEHALQDLRYALRALRKSPAFTAAAVLSLAIGIGANTALFTLIDTLLWKLLPVRDPERLLVIGKQSGASTTNGFTYEQYSLFREHVPVLDQAAYARIRLNASIDGNAEPTLDGQLVTGGYFPLLGVRPALGRLLGPDDDRVPMGHPVAVLADRYWKVRFGGDPEVIGRQILLSGVPFTIVGVAPPDFFGVEIGVAPQVFVPVMMQPTVMPMMVNLLERPNVYSTWLRVVGRLNAGGSRSQAAARLDALARAPETDWRPRDKFTGQPEDVRLVLGSAATGLSDLRQQFSQPLFLLLCVSGIVLLVACANVANLLLARSAARRPEFALRLALGAGRGRLIRQVLVEGLLLAVLAGAAGVGLAFWATGALVAYASSGQGRVVLDLSPDWRVLVFAAAVSAVAGLIFASVPALRAARTDLSSNSRLDLARTGGRAGGARGPGKWLVASQVALSLVLLVAAGVFVRSLQNLSPDHSADGSRVLIVRVEPRGSADRNRAGGAKRFHSLYQDLLERVEHIQGVEVASLARTTPLSPPSLGYPVMPAGGGPPRLLTSTIVYPKYFEAMGIPLIEGRDFNGDDLRPGVPSAVIVNEAFVREFLPGRQPLGAAHGVRQAKGVGRDSTSGAPQFRPGDPVNIVGVVKDTRFPALREAAPPLVYQTFLQASTGFAQMVLHVRTAGSDGDVARELRAAVQAVDPVVPLADIHTLADELDAALVRERLVATLSGVFAAVALLLVCIGLYGLLAFTVSQRTAEIGIRVALGATRADVRWMIARQALAVVLPGLAVGLPAAWIAARLLSRQLAGLLYELTPTDPATLGAAAVVLLLVALGAGLLPARRAAQIDPVAALRAQ
jgi:predicted permease